VKPPILLRPELQLLNARYPLIHPDDLWRALVERVARRIGGQLEARAKQKIDDRKAGRTAEQMEGGFENIFITVLADVPPEQWTEDVYAFIQERNQASKVGNFWERLARATTDLVDRRRKPLFNPMERFLLENWRVLRFPNPDNPRGLRTWRSHDAMKLLRDMARRDKEFYCGPDVKWYQRFRRRLGLTTR
jgi:hypothetical protein